MVGPRIPVLQIRKSKPEEVKHCAQGHLASKVGVGRLCGSEYLEEPSQTDSKLALTQDGEE